MSLQKYIVVLNLVKILLITCVILLRLPKCTTKPAIEMYSDNVQNYLMEFGYLPKSDIETGNLRTEDQLIESIRNLQKFANIPATGLIDEKTAALMKRQRCGQPDNPKVPDFFATNRLERRTRRYVIQGPKWSNTSLTWSLVNQTMANLDVRKVRQILGEALDVWSRGSRLTFQEVYSKDADIQVLFARRHHGDGYDFDGPGYVLAHAFYPGSGRGGDAHFDEEEKWVLSQGEGEGTNLMGVAVHEFGHSLGLGHSSVESAIMFPWYHGSQKYIELPEDDRLAIQQIYGSREKMWGILDVPQTTPSTTSTTLRSYYPDRNPFNRGREREREERERQEERERARERQRQEWQKESERREREHMQKEKERKQQKEQRERDEQERRRQRADWEKENGRRRYQTTATPKKPWNDHNHYPKYNKNGQNHPKEEKPDTCNTSYDAITIIRSELFIFKDRYMWRIGDNGLHRGFPHEITRVWGQLPSNFTHIDAVYENKQRKIVFFIGKMYYVFNSNKLEDGYPKALTTLGLPASLEKIDAVLVWSHNNRTYFYSGTMYWRFDEDIHHVELDYPRDMSIWRGIGYHIDAAFQYKDGKTYFFKGKSFWQFNDSIMHVTRSRPESSAVRWMGSDICRQSTYSNEVYDDEDQQQKERLISSKATIISGTIITVKTVLFISAMLVLSHF